MKQMGIWRLEDKLSQHEVRKEAYFWVGSLCSHTLSLVRTSEALQADCFVMAQGKGREAARGGGYQGLA